MRASLNRLAPCVLALALGGCAGDHPVGTGPFDSHGNYVEAWADNPSKWNKPPADPEPEPPPVVRVDPVAAPESRPDPTPASRPKPVSAPPKPKPKPPPTRYHTVKRGDTLYGLSKRYGTTVGKIQSANNLRGTIIRVGERLKIPR
jgi:LysM repeat protein